VALERLLAASERALASIMRAVPTTDATSVLLGRTGLYFDALADAKSAIHPRHVPVLHAVFTPSDDEIAWGHEGFDAFAAADGSAARLDSGELVDLPVAGRARRVPALAAGLAS
jgi:citrate lyase subunit beta/citryl-CoA lyase